MNALDLTAHQLDVLCWIADYRATQHYSPSLRELAIAFDCSLGGARHLALALVHKGALTLTPQIARSMVLTVAGGGVVAQARAQKAVAA